MLGTFSNDQPKIEIEIKGICGNSKKINALIDSGFNGYLTLPYELAFPLGLVLIGVESSVLADNSTTSHFVCLGQVCLDGKWVETTIDIQPSGAVLLGTKLLKKLEKKFILDCANKRVEIDNNDKE
jgi:clan AA aspartic protease